MGLNTPPPTPQPEKKHKRTYHYVTLWLIFFTPTTTTPIERQLTNGDQAPRLKLRIFLSQKTFEVVSIIEQNFDIVFECTFSLHLQIIKKKFAK